MSRFSERRRRRRRPLCPFGNRRCGGIYIHYLLGGLQAVYLIYSQLIYRLENFRIYVRPTVQLSNRYLV